MYVGCGHNQCKVIDPVTFKIDIEALLSANERIVIASCAEMLSFQPICESHREVHLSCWKICIVSISGCKQNHGLLSRDFDQWMCELSIPYVSSN